MARPSTCSVTEPTPTGGMLHIASPLQGIRSLIQTALDDAGVPFTEPHQGILAISLHPGVLEQLSVELCEWLSEEELHHCQSVVLANGSEASLADLARVQSLGSLLAPIQQKWLFELVDHNRLTSYFQPIVHIADPRTVYAYE